MIYDAVIIGGGFFGIRVGLILAAKNFKTVIIERAAEPFLRSSWRNQARIHNGYHYPRNYPTASSSHRNYQKFIQEYQECLYKDFQNIYAIAKNSYTNAHQFKSFCSKLELPCKEAPKELKGMFNLDMIEEAFLTEETVFDTNKLRSRLLSDLKKQEDKLDLKLNSEVQKISQENNTYTLMTKNNEIIKGKKVFNISYAGINHLLKSSSFELIDLKLELVEICLVNVPTPLKHLGITVMDGPFFSLVPFPAANCHSLSHVRYTPHSQWREIEDCFNPYEYLERLDEKTNFSYMQKDAQRFIPSMNQLNLKDSFMTIKTVTQRNEADDGRPIVFKKHQDNFYSILGTKFDNIYDLEIKMKEIL